MWCAYNGDDNSLLESRILAGLYRLLELAFYEVVIPMLMIYKGSELLSTMA